MSINFLDSSSPPPAAGAAINLAKERAAAQAGRTARPLKRAAPRFLGDEDDGSEGEVQSRASRLGKKRMQESDIDRLFSASLNSDEDLVLPPRIDASRHREQDARHDEIQRQDRILDDTITAGPGGEGDDVIGGEKTRKKARPRPKLDEARLLGERGFPRLRQQLKGFKLKGKGHEEDDLRRLMTVYQLWTHQMFPKGTFADTLKGVEKVCHSRALRAELKIWRDEDKGIFRPKPRTDDDGDSDANENGADQDGERPRATTSEAGDMDQAAATSPQRPKRSYFDDIPTSSPGGALERDDEMRDLDDDGGGSIGGSAGQMMRDEQEARLSRGRDTTNSFGLDLDNGDDFDDDELQAAMAADANGVDDDEMEAALEWERIEALKGSSGANVPPSRKERSAPLPFDAGKTFYGAPSKPKAAARAPPPQQKEAEDEEDLDDLDFLDDFGDEDAIMREMEEAERRTARLQAQDQQSNAPAQGSDALSQETNMELELADMEEDEDFLVSLEKQEKQPESKPSDSEGLEATLQTRDTEIAQPAVHAATVAAPEPEEEEDLYS